MNPAAPPGSLAAILDALGHGLPMLIVQVVACAVLLAVGVAIYIRLTPFREREMVAGGNAAAGTMLAGAILALAIPLAAMLATSVTLIDILVWGVVALILQLLTLGIVALAMRNFRGMIEGGNVAAAITLAGAQIAVALLNAAAMVPN
jgi:putative membrane protein